MAKSRKQFNWKQYSNYIVIAALTVILSILSFAGILESSTIYLLEKIIIAVMLAVSLSVVVGFLGELSLGHAGFMCVGAYLGGKMACLLEPSLGNGFLALIIAVLIGGAIAAICGMIIGLPALRLKGDYLAIMGPSGSGKTTLMNIIGCLDVPTSGSYELDGKNLKDLSDDDLAEIRNKHIGFVFQHFHLLPKMTALDNVALPLLYADVSLKERRERAAEALKAVGLEERMDFYPNQLSGGQCQRVAIARAMVGKPDLLLADEPTGALDTKSGNQIMEIFRQLSADGMTIVMITHEPSIADCADKTYRILDGELFTGEGGMIHGR